jgi:N4-gp56 family major capsid protein
MAARLDINATGVADLPEWIEEVWSRLVYEEAFGKMLWSNFIGAEGSGQPVSMKSDLLTKKGDTIHISQVLNLTGDGVTDETTLEGQEENMDAREITMSPTWYRHAVAQTSLVARQINQDFRMKAQKLLSRWMTTKMDNSLWTVANAGVAAGLESAIPQVLYGGSGVSDEDSLVAADTFNVALVEKAVAYLENNNIDPVVINGVPRYICLLHPFQAYNLKQDSDWIAAHKDALDRGINNPIFTLSLGSYHGVQFFSTTQCTREQNSGGSGAYIAKAVIMGAEAFARAMGENLYWEEQTTDYRGKNGIAIIAAWEDKILSANALCRLITSAVDPTAA